MTRRLPATLLLLCALAAPIARPAYGQSAIAAATAQAQPPMPPALRVFLDCYQCDTDYLHQNVNVIDYVRDREEADVHVLVTTLGTGSGGTSWTLKVIGHKRYTGRDRTTTFVTPQSATGDERRKTFARQLLLAVGPYAADTASASRLDVTWKAPSGGAAATRDRWNAWVFRTSVNGFMNGEAQTTSRSYRANLSARRVTDNWKIAFSGNGNLNRDSFGLSDGRTVRSESKNWNLNSLVVKSLGERWAAGARGGASHSSFSNIDRSYSLEPGIEFNVFPYSQYQRRSLTIQYTAGPTRFEYLEPTIYDKLEETIERQTVNVALALRQPWGSLNLFSSASQHLQHRDRYRTSSFAEAEVRLFKGLSFNIFAEYDRSKDQISLRRESASTEDILLRLQQLPSTYSYFFSTGITYTFGSIFTSVLNPRFGSN